MQSPQLHKSLPVNQNIDFLLHKTAKTFKSQFSTMKVHRKGTTIKQLFKYPKSTGCNLK